MAEKQVRISIMHDIFRIADRVVINLSEKLTTAILLTISFAQLPVETLFPSTLESKSAQFGHLRAGSHNIQAATDHRPTLEGAPRFVQSTMILSKMDDSRICNGKTDHDALWGLGVRRRNAPKLLHCMRATQTGRYYSSQLARTTCDMRTIHSTSISP